MGALERKDIITEDALAAPMVLTKELEKILAVQDQITAKSKEMSTAISSGVSTDKVKKGIQDLTDQQKEQLKVMDAISKESAKNTDSYRAAQIALQKLKDENKLALATQDSWTKSVTQANSSLTQLEQALNKNRVAYAALRTEQDRSSKTGKDLLHVIQDQDKGVKAIRDSMGQAQAHVGGYREEIEKLIPALSSLAPEAVEAGEAAAGLGTKLLAIVASPITLGLAALAAGFFLVKTSLEQFFERSIEGEDVATRFKGDWTATIEVLKDKFSELGKSISDALGLNEHSFARAQVNILKYMLPMSTFSKDLAKKQVEVNELSEKQIEQRKEELVIGVEIAEQEKQKAEAQFDSRDKLRKSDQDRFDAALNQRKAIEEEIRLKLKQNDLEQEIARAEVKVGGDTYEAEKRLSDLKEKRVHIESELFQGQRRSLQTLDTIAKESLARELATQKSIEDATKLSDETIVKAAIDKDNRIIGNQNFTAAEQLAAQRDLTNQQLQLVSIGAERQTETARDEAINRVKLNSDELKAIFEASKGNLEELTQLTVNANNEKFTQDEAYIAKTKAIDEDAALAEQVILKDDVNKKAKILIDNSTYFINLKKRFIDEDRAKDLQALEESFSAGEVNLRQYAVKKAEILRGGNQIEIGANKQSYIDELKALQDFLKKNVDLYGANKDQIIALIKSLQTEIQHITESGNALAQQAAKERLALAKQLQTELFASAVTTGDNIFKYQQDQSSAHIQHLTDDMNTQLKLVGNNANAKILIEHDYGVKIREEEKKLRKSQHDQAIFDRDIAAVQIAVNIAEGIAKIWGEGYPYPVALGLTAIVAAIGAAQELAVLSKPIPSYEVGTDNHPGGLAAVGHGIELVREPGRKPFIISTPEIMNLARGTEVLTDSETTAALAMAGVARSANGDKQVRPIIVNNNADVVDAVNKIRLPNIIVQGREIMEVWESRDGSRKWVQSKIFWKC